MRQRIEDLGRIAAILSKELCDHSLFSLYIGRNKDFTEYFELLSEEKKDDLLHSMIYGISDLRDQLYELLEIANGEDRLNQERE
tara:strand:+ start:1032 stop:1283 length:252 start_codon:yes stop_codon:yes gene_type:complete